MNRAYIVEEGHRGLRLDVYLSQVIEDVPSRTFVKKLMDGDKVTVNSKQVKNKYKVATGDQVIVDVDPSDWAKHDIEAQDLSLDIFYEDEDIAIVNKPSGLTVHPAAGGKSGTLVNGLVHHFQKDLSDVNGDVRPGIVHRLDKDTSGLLVIAKTNMSHARLGRQFEKHTVMKRYVALVEGQVQFDQGRIDVPLKRHVKYHDQRQVARVGETSAKEAETLYQVIKRNSHTTLIGLYPQTGRTHQLRVHMKHLGHPILGDDKYGRKDSFTRLALHAQSIGFVHPTTKEYVEFSCPIPKEFNKS